MSDKEYGIEDICESLDGIERQLKRLVAILKFEAKRKSYHPETIVEIDNI